MNHSSSRSVDDTGRWHSALRGRQTVSLNVRIGGIAQHRQHLGAAALFAILVPVTAIADNETPTDDTPPPAIKPGLIYNGAAFANLGGGVRSGGTFTSNLQGKVDLDLTKLVGWEDAIAYVSGLWLQGGQPSSFTGDAQGISSISGPNVVKLYEAWIQRNFASNHFSLLAGQYDLNSEFYRLQSAGLFLNSSFGIGPELAQSGVAGSSVFPNTAVGMRVGVKSDDGVVARMAVLDGVPVDRPNGSHGIFEAGDGALIVAEVALLDRPPSSDRPVPSQLRIGRKAMLGNYESKLAIGGWYYTAYFDDLSETQANGQPVRHHGSAGFYVLADRLLFRDPTNDQRTLFGFVQVGLGDERVDRFGSYLGAGLAATGIVPNRSNDELGLGIAFARNGSHYFDSQHLQGLPVTRAETAIELTYLIQVNSWLALQPDLQYVISPNTTQAIPNAFALQLRIEASF